jgi:exopolysaccharide production protein ExoQ
MKSFTPLAMPAAGAVEAPWREPGTAVVAAALFFLAPTQLNGALGTTIATAQLALVGLLVILSPRSAANACLRWLPILALPLVTVASALWSSVPDLSFRYGAQFLLTCFIGTTLGLALSMRVFLGAFLVAAFAFCIASIASHNEGMSATGMVLVGLTGSKNQLGNEAQICLFSAVVLLLDRASDLRLRLLALALLPIAGFLLWQSNAATPLLLAVLGIVVIVAYSAVMFLPPAGRTAAILGLGLIALPLSALAPEAQQAANNFASDVLNKDPTLTGRTYLWEKADQLIPRRPLLGYGYKAIWVGNSPETIGLRRWAGIEDGRTFHFHDTYRQIRVDTGIVGLAAFLFTLIATGFGQLATFFLKPTMPAAFFLAFFLTTLIRAPTEVFFDPFSIQTILFFACAVYSIRGLQEIAAGTQRYNRPAMHAVPGGVA